MSQWGATPAVPSSPQQQMPRVVEDLQIWVREGGGGRVTAGLNYAPREVVEYESIISNIRTNSAPEEGDADSKKVGNNAKIQCPALGSDDLLVGQH